MRLEDLLEFTAEKLEAMSDKELENCLSPYFQVTRPDLSKQKENKVISKGSKQSNMEFNLKMNKARNLAKSFGIDLG